MDPQRFNVWKRWKRGLEIQLKTKKLRIMFSIFSGKHINYSKPEIECTLKQIMFLYLFRIIQNVERSSGKERTNLQGKVLHQ